MDCLYGKLFTCTYALQLRTTKTKRIMSYDYEYIATDRMTATGISTEADGTEHKLEVVFDYSDGYDKIATIISITTSNPDKRFIQDDVRELLVGYNVEF